MNADSSNTPQPQSARMQEAGLLTLLSDSLAQQKNAILSGNASLLNHLFESLSGMAAELEEAGEAAASSRQEASAAVRSQIDAIREQIAINQKLLSNGMAVTDHFVRSVAEFDPAIANPLFSGVA
jgi:CHASE3 domain sensor protein